MSDDYVQVAADGAGKKVDNDLVITDAGSVYRQRVRVSAADIDSGVVQGNADLVLHDVIDVSQAFWLDGVLIVCGSGANVQVEITDGAGHAIVPSMDFYGATFLVQPFHGMPVTGLRLAAPATVTVRAWGRK